jgi:hypothetical protein
MTITLGVDEALALLDQAVAERGADHVYPKSEKAVYPTGHVVPMCSYYVEDGDGWRPSCIIGHVIEYLGLREEFLSARRDYEGTPGVGVLKHLGVQFEDLTTEQVLDEAQQNHDIGEPWADVVEMARSVLL